MTTRGADYERRKNDDYPTPPEVTTVLFDLVPFSRLICDPACGAKQQILKVAKANGYQTMGMDIIKPWKQDFLDTRLSNLPKHTDIVTNPPYGDRRGTLALRFVEKALELVWRDMGKVAMLLPIDFDSGKTRSHVFASPAFAMKIVLLDRIKWFDGQSGSTNHAWYVWSWWHSGPPIIKYARIP